MIMRASSRLALTIVIVGLLGGVVLKILVTRHATYHDTRAMALAAKVELGMTSQELFAEVGAPRGRVYNTSQLRQIPGRKGIERISVPTNGSIVWYAPEPGSMIFVLVLLDQNATVQEVEILPSRGRLSSVPKPIPKKRR